MGDLAHFIIIFFNLVWGIHVHARGVLALFHFQWGVCTRGYNTTNPLGAVLPVSLDGRSCWKLRHFLESQASQLSRFCSNVCLLEVYTQWRDLRSSSILLLNEPMSRHSSWGDTCLFLQLRHASGTLYCLILDLVCFVPQISSQNVSYVTGLWLGVVFCVIICCVLCDLYCLY